jgi:hypothetical protein
MLLKKIAHHPNLAEPVLLGNDGEDGFIEAASQELHLVSGDKLSEEVPTLPVGRSHMLEKRPGIMGREFYAGMLPHFPEERPVAVFTGRFENRREVTDGLVVVDGEKKRAPLSHGESPLDDKLP